VPSKAYDLIISNKSELLGMETYFPPSSVRIFLASVTNHRVHNQRLRLRHQRLTDRRRCAVRMRRAYSEKMSFVECANAIVGFGNHVVMDTWRDVFEGPIYPFNNYGFKETVSLRDGKDFDAARRHFLFFASASQMQKGLDLLLEIFPRLPHLHLHVCGPFHLERDFCRCYRKELRATPNIHAHGWMWVNSPDYEDLLRKCAYVIHPSCSEGQSGSVVQCMYSGLIPLLTREAGIDTEDFGVTFRDDSLEEIERVVREVAELPEDWHRERSVKTRQAAEANYSEDAFLDRWRDMLGEILGKGTQRGGHARSMVSAG
jgi:glycosyltransferase involved in cell wall biosynthesis